MQIHFLPFLRIFLQRLLHERFTPIEHTKLDNLSFLNKSFLTLRSSARVRALINVTRIRLQFNTDKQVLRALLHNR